MQRRHYRLSIYHDGPDAPPRVAVYNWTESDVRGFVYGYKQIGVRVDVHRLPDDWGQVDTFGGGGGNKAASSVDRGPCPGCYEHCGAACPNAWDGDEEKRRYS